MKKLILLKLSIVVLLSVASCGKKDVYDELLEYGEQIAEYESIEYSAFFDLERSYSSRPMEWQGTVYFDVKDEDTIAGTHFRFDATAGKTHYIVSYADERELYLIKDDSTAHTFNTKKRKYIGQPFLHTSTETIRKMLSADSLRQKISHLTKKDTSIRDEESVMFSFQAPKGFVYPLRSSSFLTTEYDNDTQYIKIAFSKESELPNYFSAYKPIRKGGYNWEQLFISDIKLNKKYPKEKLTLEGMPAYYTLGPPPGTNHKLLPIGEEAPDFTLSTLEGQEVNLKELRGKTVMLEFWFIGCGPCIEAAPDLNKIYKNNKGDDFKLFSVNVFEDDVQKIKDYKDRYKMNFPTLWDSEEMAEDYKINAGPIIYIINPDGTIGYTSSGFAGYDKVQKEIQQAKKYSI